MPLMSHTPAGAIRRKNNNDGTVTLYLRVPRAEADLIVRAGQRGFAAAAASATEAGTAGPAQKIPDKATPVSDAASFVLKHSVRLTGTRAASFAKTLFQLQGKDAMASKIKQRDGKIFVFPDGSAILGFDSFGSLIQLPPQPTLKLGFEAMGVPNGQQNPGQLVVNAEIPQLRATATATRVQPLRTMDAPVYAQVRMDDASADALVRTVLREHP